MLVTGRQGIGVSFYQERMKMEVLEQGELAPMSWVGPGWGGGGEEARAYLAGEGEKGTG